jgi:hypothetical protein
MSINWISWPTGGAIVEAMAIRRLKVIYDFHAVDMDAKPKHTLCGVKIESLCEDSSQFTRELPDCPRCKDKILRAQAAEAKRLRQIPPTPTEANRR